MNYQIWVSIIIYMVFMLLIGFWSYKRTQNLSDYMLGGRKLGPAVTALSAGASDMSGWMLMGLPGAMYATGLSSMWISVGLVIGAYLNYIFLAPRLRTYTEVANNSITIPDYLENRFHDKTKLIRLVSATIIFIFFTLYASAGLVSGGRLFESAFGLQYQTGLLLTAGIVVVYTLFGGFLAVSWTDFFQGIIMFIALVLVPVVAFTSIGDGATVVREIKNVDPLLLDAFQGTTVIGILSFLAWGLGYFGQPHIIVRFMAISDVKELKAARRIGIGWMAVGVTGAMLTGLIGVAYYHQNNMTIDDPETIFIMFANLLFHPYITGFLYAAILAAIMSTISSQLLVTSSAMTQDFYRTFKKRDARDRELVFIGRLSVLIVAIIAIFLSLNPNDTILGLVGYAWAGFGSAFGPAILLSLYWKRMTKWGAFAGMLVGAITVLIWSNIELLNSFMYEMIPGFMLSFIAIILVSLLTQEKQNELNEKIQATFEQVEKKMK